MLCFGLPLRLRAQASFRPGYIITLQGDTVRGSVDYASNVRGATECRFKPAATDVLEKYQPAQLNGYGVLHDRFYQAHTILRVNPSVDTTSQRVFLEVLVQGAATLFYYADDNSTSQYFIQIGTRPVQPLVLRIDYVVENGSRLKREKALFRGTLATALQGCPAVQSKVGTVRFTVSDLSSITRQYNDCVGGRQVVSEVAAPKRRSYFLLEAVVGVQTSTLRFSGDIDLRDAAISGGVRPIVGIALQQYLPTMANRLGLRVELLYQPQRYEQEVLAPVAPYAAFKEVRVHLDQLRVPVALRYKPLNGRFQPFVEVGGSIAIALTNTNEYRYISQSSSASSSWNVILPSPRGIEQSLLVGAGTALLLPNQHHATASFRAERTNGFSQAVGIGNSITRFYFLLNYGLTRQH